MPDRSPAAAGSRVRASLRTGDPNALHSTMLLTGSDGTITLDLVGQFGQLPAPIATGDGRWIVADATGDYASLQGRGTVDRRGRLP